MSYDEIKQLAKELRRPIRTLLALKDLNDPFAVDMPRPVNEAVRALQAGLDLASKIRVAPCAGDICVTRPCEIVQRASRVTVGLVAVIAEDFALKGSAQLTRMQCR